MKWLKRILFIIFSSGWILPLFLSGYSYFTWLQNDVKPFIHGKKPGMMHSFPHLQFAQETFYVAAIWLFLVTALWSYLIYTKHLENK